MSTLFKADILTESHGNVTPRLQLRAGDRLTGTVLSEQSGDKILVDFGSFRAFAEIRFPVKPADILPVLILEVGPKLKLQLIAPGSDLKHNQTQSPVRTEALSNAELNQIYRTLSDLLDIDRPVESTSKMTDSTLELLARLRDFIKPLDLTVSGDQLARRLQSLIEDSGLLFEHKLAGLATQKSIADEQSLSDLQQPMARLSGRDLKPILLKLHNLLIRNQEGFDPKNADRWEPVKTAVDKLLGRIADFQDRTIAGQKDGTHLLFSQIPVHLEQADATVRLQIGLPRRKRKDSEDSVRIVLCLELPALGAIRSDITFTASELRVVFYVDDPTVKKTIEDRLADLNHRLEGLFERINLQVFESVRKVADARSGMDLSSGYHRIDIRA